MNEDTLRSSLYQFFGAALSSAVSAEAGIALIIEELTKLVSTNTNSTQFDKTLIKPMIKSTHYIITQQYNNLLKDSKDTFQDNIPIPVKVKLDMDKKLIELLDGYIKQL